MDTRNEMGDVMTVNPHGDEFAGSRSMAAYLFDNTPALSVMLLTIAKYRSQSVSTFF
jgi:hypothetical protein